MHLLRMDLYIGWSGELSSFLRLVVKSWLLELTTQIKSEGCAGSQMYHKILDCWTTY